MLYYLMTQTQLAESLPGARVFEYISFRTAWGIITALVVTYLIFPWFIAKMKSMKMEQIIRDDGPESHLLTKIGTPTMGGVCIIVGIAVSALLWSRLDGPTIWIVLLVLVGYGAIGFADDWMKVVRRSSDGLSGRYKIFWQLIVGSAAMYMALKFGVVEPVLQVPFLKETTIDFVALAMGSKVVGMGLFTLFSLFILVGTSNAVNLTDGLDGLAIGPVMTSAATYGVLAYLAGHAKFASYLGILHIDGAGELTILAFAMVGAGLGFLWYNAYPAQVFMGDVGSLSLGGVLGIVAILAHQEILLVLVGGIFVMEAVSVILQVFSFKTFGKRIFKMAPIHHHYERKGWSEPKIIVRFWIISIILALVALSTLKIR